MSSSPVMPLRSCCCSTAAYSSSPSFWAGFAAISSGVGEFSGESLSSGSGSDTTVRKQTLVVSDTSFRRRDSGGLEVNLKMSDSDEDYEHSSSSEEENISYSEKEEEEDDEVDSEKEEKLTTSVVVGQMSIARDHVDMYKRLTDKFGEIVSENLPAYKVEPTNGALKGLLNVVNDMLSVTPETICQEKVQEWREMSLFYTNVGLKVGWLQERVDRCGEWLARRASVGEKIQERKNKLEVISKEARALERELQELATELERVRDDRFRFDF